MSSRKASNIPASIAARVRNWAAANARTFQHALNRYVTERFFARLEASEFAERLVLKDGNLLVVWFSGKDYRRNAPGDRLVVLLDGVEAASAAPKGLTETGAAYAVDLACPPPGTVWEIRVEDDDGQGVEGWITTGRFRLREPN